MRAKLRFLLPIFAALPLLKAGQQVLIEARIVGLNTISGQVLGILPNSPSTITTLATIPGAGSDLAQKLSGDYLIPAGSKIWQVSTSGVVSTFASALPGTNVVSAAVSADGSVFGA